MGGGGGQGVAGSRSSGATKASGVLIGVGTGWGWGEMDARMEGGRRMERREEVDGWKEGREMSRRMIGRKRGRVGDQTDGREVSIALVPARGLADVR